MLLHRQCGELVRKGRHASLVLHIWSVLVILLDNLHDERDESLDKDLAAFAEVTPFFEEVDELLAKVTLTVVVAE